MPRTEEAVTIQSCPREIIWNQEGENKLRGSYGKGSILTLRRRKKSAQELEKEALRRIILQHFGNVIVTFGLISNVDSPERLAESPNSGIGNTITPVCPLSEVPSGCAFPRSKQEIEREQRVNALADMTRLLGEKIRRAIATP